MGVIDPLDSKTTALEGRGKRVTLRDASEKVLADFIIGNEIKGTERGKEGGGGSVRPRARPEADLRRGRQGRALDAVRRLDRDQPAEGRHQQGPQGPLRQLQDAGDADARTASRCWPRSGDEQVTITRKESFGPWDVAIEKWDPKSGRMEGGRHAGRPGGQRGPAPVAHRRARRPEDRRRAAQAAGRDRPQRPQARADRCRSRLLAPEPRLLPVPRPGALLGPGRRHRHDRRRGRLHPPIRRARSSPPGTS